MSQPGLRSRFELSFTALWLTAAALLVCSASCARGDTSSITCDDGLAMCGGAECVDTQVDPDHCGGCDGVCASGQRCEAGECVGEDKGNGGGGGDQGGIEAPGESDGTGGALCAPGLEPCSGGCVDLDINPHHCGGCGQECPAGQLCEGGACRCDGGLAECGGGCADLTKDPLHCGGCDVRCGPNATCVDGECACDEGLTACDGKCVDLASHPQHCGACGAACGGGLVCQAGTCACIVGEHEVLGSTTPQVVRGSTLGADTYFGLDCVAAGSSEVVYAFTADEPGTYRFDTAGSSYDTAIAVLDRAVCGELACNDDRAGPEAAASVILEGGEEVLVVVSGYNGAQGDFVLRIDRAAPPACPVGTLEPTLPQSVHGDTWALGDALVASCGSLDTPDASYAFTAPHAGRFIFDTTGSSFDTVLELRSGTCTGSMISCNNNNASEKTSRVVANLTAGQTVVAIVDGAEGEYGPFTLNVSEYVPPPCPEFVLDAATFPQRVTGTTAIVDRESALSAPCGTGAGPEATYAFTAPADALYTFDTIGTGFDTALHIHDGTCSGPSLGCNDDVATGVLQSQVKVLLDEGQTVIVVVDGYSSSATGAYTLNVSQTFVPPCPLIDLGTTVPQTVTGTTADAVDLLRPTCGGAGGRETTYSFTAPEAGTYLIDTFGSSFNTTLAALDGSCSGTAIACNADAAGSQQSQLTLDLEEGQTIILLIDGDSAGASGDFTLNIERFDGGGTCSTPIELGSSYPQVVTGSTVDQPRSVTPSCGSSTAPDMVYSFTAPENGTFIFDTLGSSFDTVLQVLNGSCRGASLGCNDDSSGGRQSRVSTVLAAGQTVFIVVDGRGTSAGDYVLQVDRFTGPGTCSTAIDLGSELPLTRTGTTSGQPNSATPVSSCTYSSTAADMVFTYTAPADGDYVIDTIGSSYDTVLHVHSDGCGGETLKCNDDWGGTSRSRVRLTLTAGEVITVVVDGYGSLSGSFTLNINPAP
ncbi:MXAN_6577-like cysteine-rich protein [Sorangium sp. So ce185]|uniref:MXAN_6577-like cysteine-rich protein n=1 Tax=Sorangium sp. So ce185 TaxID=3133287 RepID=UPI003F61AFB8